jgi:acyl dehydratase
MTASIAAGMMQSIHGEHVLAGLGIERLKFMTPVIPGDTVRTRITVHSMRPTSDGRRGVLAVQVDLLNQRDDVTVEFLTSFMMRRSDA